MFRAFSPFIKGKPLLLVISQITCFLKRYERLHSFSPDSNNFLISPAGQPISRREGGAISCRRQMIIFVAPREIQVAPLRNRHSLRSEIVFPYFPRRATYFLPVGRCYFLPKTNDNLSRSARNISRSAPKLTFASLRNCIPLFPPQGNLFPAGRAVLFLAEGK